MNITVELQPPMLYMTRFTVIALVCAAAAAVLWFFFIRSIRKEPVGETEPVHDAAWRERTRRSYAAQLTELEARLDAGEIDMRQAYQEMSSVLRLFVHEMTGIHVHEFTLTEIRKVGIPRLTQLVSSYYTPEFALWSRADARKALKKTKDVIQTWN